jgi:hypothetical protein
MILFDLIVVQGLHLGDELRLIFRQRIGFGLWSRRTTLGLRHGSREIDVKRIVAHFSNQSAEKVMPDAVQIGMPIGQMRRRLQCGIGVSRGFDRVASGRRTIVRLTENVSRRNQNRS